MESERSTIKKEKDKYVFRCGSKQTRQHKEKLQEINWTHLSWRKSRILCASVARFVQLLSSQNVQHCVTTSDLWMADPSLSLSVSYSLSVSVTSTPVGLTLLNKASSKMTPSCLSALLCNKSFIKHRGARRSISNHRDWELMCVSARVSVFSPFYHWVVGLMLLY